MKLTIKREVLDILPESKPSPQSSKFSRASSTTDLTGSPLFDGSCTPISLSPAACILRPLSPSGVAVPPAVLVGTYIGPPDENPEQFLVLDLIGSGTDGDVVKVVEISSSCLFAMKLLPLISLQYGPDKTKSIKAELVNHKDLIHPHIVKFHTVFAAQGFLCTVMEHATHGTLLDFMNQSEAVPEETCILIFNQIALAVEYCHRKGVCNRDLKPENILLTSGYQMPFPTVKICDFGHSKSVTQSAPRTSVGTPCYMAPEVIMRESGSYDGPAADAFSCGIVLYCLLYGRHPFVRPEDEDIPNEAARAMAVVPRIVNMEWQHVATANISDAAKDLLDKLLTTADKRISMSQVLRHSWCTSLQPELPSLNNYFLALQTSEVHTSPSPSLKYIDSLLQSGSQSPNVPQCLFGALVRQNSSCWITS